ncbi:MAG: hypothetical protein AAB019_05400 [Planctomycetota bacterium]
MSLKQVISGIIILVGLFFSHLAVCAEEPAPAKEYLVKFKIGDSSMIKTLGEKYRVEFKEAIPELGVYSSILNDDVLRQLSQEEIVVYVEPNVGARTTYADVEGTQEIITDAPWYLAPERTEIPVLLFLPEIYWKGAKASGLQLTEFIIANPQTASSDWSFADNWKPTKNILYQDTN